MGWNGMDKNCVANERLTKNELGEDVRGGDKKRENDAAIVNGNCGKHRGPFGGPQRR